MNLTLDDRQLVGIYAYSWRTHRVSPSFKSVTSRKRLRKMSRQHGRARVRHMARIDGTPMPAWYSARDMVAADLELMKGLDDAKALARSVQHDVMYRNYNPTEKRNITND